MVKGKEIAQLYVGLALSAIIRPLKELKGFVKVELQPGETKRVNIPFDDKTFRYFNVKTNKWEVEGGEYDIYIGASSADICLTGTIQIEGTNAEAPYVKTELPNYAVGNLRNIPDEEFAKLLGHDIPNGALPFYKKNRMVIDYNTTFQELRYSRRWIGRLIGKAIPWFTRVLYKCGNRVLANTLVMGVVHQPMRGMSRFSQGGLRMSQLDGLISMFNGHFFSGLHHFFKEGRKYKRLAKEEKKAQKEAEAQKQAEVEEVIKEEPVLNEEVVEEAPVVETPVEEVMAEEPVQEETEQVIEEEAQPVEEKVEEAPIEEQPEVIEEQVEEVHDENEGTDKLQ